MGESGDGGEREKEGKKTIVFASQQATSEEELADDSASHETARGAVSAVPRPMRGPFSAGPAQPNSLFTRVFGTWRLVQIFLYDADNNAMGLVRSDEARFEFVIQ